MALWDKLKTRGNVDDRRGLGGNGLVFGLPTGIVATAVALGLGYFGLSADPQLVEQLISLSGVGQSQTTKQPEQFRGNDDYEQFASTVLGSTDEYWAKQFSANSATYEKPRLVLFRDRTQSACGVATSQVGPHYCPRDNTIYLDETFFDALKTELGGSDGDVAQAYVLAHEVGHHVQNLEGSLSSARSNAASVQTELQADCYAGLWANRVKTQGVFENNREIEEALSAASAVGDDRIQKKSTGQVNPETWTHGSSKQRVDAFKTGYGSETASVCR